MMSTASAGPPGGDDMATAVNMKVYANDDDALIIWSVPRPIRDCLGLAIERRIYDRTDPALQTVLHNNVLPNRIGFVDDLDAQPGRTRVSTKWPFQRFWWTDHDTDQDDIVSYRVVPMVGEVDELTKLEDQASAWSPIRVLSALPNSRDSPRSSTEGWSSHNSCRAIWRAGN